MIKIFITVCAHHQPVRPRNNSSPEGLFRWPLRIVGRCTTPKQFRRSLISNCFDTFLSHISLPSGPGCLLYCPVLVYCVRNVFIGHKNRQQLFGSKLRRKLKDREKNGPEKRGKQTSQRQSAFRKWQ